tara:strand:+ start:1134 stop:1496 length:363 start_codon:yes stop_codon:yes gene_type:complete
MKSLLFPIIKELEDLARSHPDPTIRADVMHLIDVLSESPDPELLAIMHDFYRLREQLREEREINDLLGKETQTIAPFALPDLTEEKPAFAPNMFQDVLDEIEVDDMMMTHRRWNVTIGEA